MTIQRPILSLYMMNTVWLSVFWSSKIVLENATKYLDETDHQQKTKL